jgi:hypothetical protein
MVGHINVEEQVDTDLVYARRKKAFRRLIIRLRGDHFLATPPCFG